MKALSECKALESNIRRIQVKDIVKEVEDYLKTYSSARMDISSYAGNSISSKGAAKASASFFEFVCLLRAFDYQQICIFGDQRLEKYFMLIIMVVYLEDKKERIFEG
ncbi:hypothetical protein Tco_0215880 [Tanacetum coccineum]